MCFAGPIGLDTVCPMYMQHVWGLAIDCNRSKYLDSNATCLVMSIKLSIKSFTLVRPVFEASELTMCEVFEEALFIRHATSLQSVDHASHVGIAR